MLSLPRSLGFLSLSDKARTFPLSSVVNEGRKKKGSLFITRGLCFQASKALAEQVRHPGTVAPSTMATELQVHGDSVWQKGEKEKRNGTKRTTSTQQTG